MSGPYADAGGVGSTLAAQMAVEESGLAAKGWKVNVVTADHQNKADIGTNIAREWFDQGKADVIVDSLNSGVSLAVEPGRQGKEQGLAQFRRRNLGSYRQGLHAEPDPLGL